MGLPLIGDFLGESLAANWSSSENKYGPSLGGQVEKGEEILVTHSQRAELKVPGSECMKKRAKIWWH